MTPLDLKEGFDLRGLVYSHGWVKLDPFQWDEGSGTLSHSAVLSGGGACEWTVQQASELQLAFRVRSKLPLTLSEVGEAAKFARWALRLDESLAGFWEICSFYGPLDAARRAGAGRLLRSTTVWEDLAKTLCTTCTTWGRTRSMVSALCSRWGAIPYANLADSVGDRSDSTGGDAALPRSACTPAFPTPAVIAAASEVELRSVAGLGYRAKYLRAIASKVSAGELDLERLKDDHCSTEELRRFLLTLPGLGPYAAANLLMLLGRYDYIALDSWVRRVVGKGWFAGETVTDREILAAFERFGPWKALVYWFWDWEGAAEEWTWRGE